MLGAILGAAGGLLGGVLQGRASKKASDAQADASEAQVALQREIYYGNKAASKRSLAQQTKANTKTRRDVESLARDNRNALSRFAGGERNANRRLASTAYGRNRDLLTGARDEIHGDIVRDRDTTWDTLQSTRDQNLQGFDKAEARNLSTLKGVRDRSMGLYQPAYDMGNNALGAYGYELGLGEKPKGYEGLEMSPAAKFMLEQGRTETEGGAAGAGGLYSGATMEALEKLRSGYAMQDKNNQMGQMFNLVGVGQNAAGSMAGIEQNYGAGTTGQRNLSQAARAGVWSDYADDRVNALQYWNGAEADATGRYTGALAGLNDTNFSRQAGINSDYFGARGGVQAGYTGAMTDAANNWTDRKANALNNRVSQGMSAGQNFANGASSALGYGGDARAVGAVGGASGWTSGINNALTAYTSLGGNFDWLKNMGQGSVLGNTSAPMNQPPMARPA